MQWRKKKADYYQFDRREIAQFLPATYAHVLEIGCGEGHFRQNVAPGVEYWGVEPVPDVAEKARTRLDHVLVGTFEEVADALPDGFFDLVVCNDVIEHMPWTDRFLTQIAGKMTPSGYLVGSIPNVRHISNLYHLLAARDWHYAPSGILDNTHFRFFTHKSLIRTFRESPFTIQMCRGFRRSSFRYPVFNPILWLAALLLGFDILYLQFGFRLQRAAKPVKPGD